MMYIHNVKGLYIFYIILYLVSMHLFKANNVFSWIYKFVDRLLCCQYLYSYDANDLPKAINHKLFKNSLQMEMHFELLEEKNPLISVDLEPQILSYELSRKYGAILIEMIEYTFCVMMIEEMNSIILYSVNILILVENCNYQSIDFM